MKEAETRSYGVMEMKMLRWSLGHTRLDRIRNDDIRAKIKVQPIANSIAASRLRWFGHVQRRPDEAVCRTADQVIFSSKKNRKGRPRKNWMENLSMDMKTAGLSAEDAMDRIKWRNSAKQAYPTTIG